MTPEHIEKVNETVRTLDAASKMIRGRNLSYLNHGIYRHYKGGLYYMINVAIDSSAPDDGGPTPRVVVYTNILPDECGNHYLFTRPYEDFTARVEHEGQVTERFTWLGYSL
jgi:hypothetical protein